MGQIQTPIGAPEVVLTHTISTATIHNLQMQLTLALENETQHLPTI